MTLSNDVLTSSQRAKLRAMAQTIQPIFQLGKGGITPAFIAQVDQALTAREIVKITVLKTADMSAAQALEALCQATGASPVQSIGFKCTLYRPNPEQPVIEL
nr:YhbY family RNA-binding protein [bacterium]